MPGSSISGLRVPLGDRRAAGQFVVDAQRATGDRGPVVVRVEGRAVVDQPRASLPDEQIRIAGGARIGT